MISNDEVAATITAVAQQLRTGRRLSDVYPTTVSIRREVIVVRVLVVEDEGELAELVADGMRREGMAVDVSFDGGDGLYRASHTRYDVVVLDRDLPVVHGDDVCRRLAEGDDPPRVLMLTAASAERDQVQGLSIGADDYLAKPFSFPVLIARVRALARRAGRFRPPRLERGDLVLDTARRYATRDGVPLRLTRKELAVLEALLEADGGVVERGAAPGASVG